MTQRSGAKEAEWPECGSPPTRRPRAAGAAQRGPASLSPPPPSPAKRSRHPRRAIFSPASGGRRGRRRIRRQGDGQTGQTETQEGPGEREGGRPRPGRRHAEEGHGDTSSRHSRPVAAVGRGGAAPPVRVGGPRHNIFSAHQLSVLGALQERVCGRRGGHERVHQREASKGHAERVGGSQRVLRS